MESQQKYTYTRHRKYYTKYHKCYTKLNKNSLCIYCNKCFSRNDSLKQHQLKCNKKIEDDLYKKQIAKINR